MNVTFFIGSLYGGGAEKVTCSLAENLAQRTTEVRVIFYEVQGRGFFGELTFFDGSGLMPILPIEWDRKLGSWLELDNK